MHDIKDLRKNLQVYKKKFSNRNYNFDFESFQSLDNTNRKLINEKEKLEQEKKYYLNQKIKINLKNQKKFQRKFRKY